MILLGLTVNIWHGMCEILGQGGKGTGTYANRNLLQISNLMVTPQNFMVDHPFLMTLNTIAIFFLYPANLGHIHLWYLGGTALLGLPPPHLENGGGKTSSNYHLGKNVLWLLEPWLPMFSPASLHFDPSFWLLDLWRPKSGRIFCFPSSSYTHACLHPRYGMTTSVLII